MSLAFRFGTKRCRAAAVCAWLVCCIAFAAGDGTDLAVVEDRSNDEGQTLYNGIRLPSPWPPQQQSLSLEPRTPPYIVSPPEVITIDVGRQVFVDDFLVEHTTLKGRSLCRSAAVFGTIRRTNFSRCGTTPITGIATCASPRHRTASAGANRLSGQVPPTIGTLRSGVHFENAGCTASASIPPSADSMSPNAAAAIRRVRT